MKKWGLGLKTENIVAVIEKKENYCQNDFLQILQKATLDMQNKKIQRMNIQIHPVPKEENEKYVEQVTGKWVNIEDHGYYPEDSLSKEEREIAEKNESYKVVSLIFSEKEDKFLVEECTRIYAVPMLPKLKKGCNLLYTTFPTYNTFEDFAEVLVRSEWTPKMLKELLGEALQKVA